MTVAIPIAAGQQIAEAYGYDQVVIVARKVGGNEHVTTYGVNKEHCGVAARMGNFFKHKLMGWPQPEPTVRGDWRSVDVAGLPTCDGETVFVGFNSAGFASCFNHVNQDGLCLMGTAEGSTAQMSELRYWRVLEKPNVAINLPP